MVRNSRMTRNRNGIVPDHGWSWTSDGRIPMEHKLCCVPTWGTLAGSLWKWVLFCTHMALVLDLRFGLAKVHARSVHFVLLRPANFNRTSTPFSSSSSSSPFRVSVSTSADMGIDGQWHRMSMEVSSDGATVSAFALPRLIFRPFSSGSNLTIGASSSVPFRASSRLRSPPDSVPFHSVAPASLLRPTFRDLSAAV